MEQKRLLPRLKNKTPASGYLYGLEVQGGVLTHAFWEFNQPIADVP